MLANQKATQLKKEKLALYERIDKLKTVDEGTDVVVNLTSSWKTADYDRKKDVAMIMNTPQDGSTKIIWNI